MSASSCCSRPAHVAPPEDLYFYRDRTISVLRKYFQMSIDLGRLPSLFGREFFRAKVTSYKRTSFEDIVVFVHDIERCIDDLNPFSQQLIARIVLQNYTQEEAARLLGRTDRWVREKFPEALDEITSIFLDRGILFSLPKHQPCQ